MSKYKELPEYVTGEKAYLELLEAAEKYKTDFETMEAAPNVFAVAVNAWKTRNEIRNDLKDQFEKNRKAIRELNESNLSILDAISAVNPDDVADVILNNGIHAVMWDDIVENRYNCSVKEQVLLKIRKAINSNKDKGVLNN